MSLTRGPRFRRLTGLLLLLGAPVAAGAQQQFANRAAYVVRFSSAGADGQEIPALLRQPLTLHLRRTTVERALREVASRAGLELAYSRAVVPLERVVSVSVENESVIEALRQVLVGTGVELWIAPNGRMALVPEQRAARDAQAAQTGTIAGRVTAAEGGEPLASVTVGVSGTRLGALTNAEGRFTIVNVPVGRHVVYAQRIGFGRDTAIVTVEDGQTATVEFVLRGLAVRLSEVVSIGYGTTTRRELTTAVSSVSGEEIARTPVTTVAQALQGRAPGVQVTTSSGAPGATAAVRVRGGNSISAGNEPLYVIDGVPVQSAPANTGTLRSEGMSGLNPLATLNPADVESIDVLKDASATAIYGARAANGVILITTKRGSAGGNTVNFGAYYGAQAVRRRLPLLDAQQFARAANLARTNAGNPALYSEAEIASLPNTNWQDEIFRTAPMQNYELSFAGGNENTRYFLSGNLLRQDGVVTNTNMDRGAVRLNLDQNVSDRFRVGSRFTYSRSQGQVMPNQGAGAGSASVIINALTAPPTLPVYGSNGEYWIGTNPANGFIFANPVGSAVLVTNYERQNRFLGNAFGEYDLSGNLTFRTSLGTDYLSSLQDYYAPTTSAPGYGRGGFGSRGSFQTTTWLSENTLRFTPGELGVFRHVELLGGVTLQRTAGESVAADADNFATDQLGPNGLGSGQNFLGIWTEAPHSSLLSYFARANWNFADRYLFTVTQRVDGSSKFGPGNRYGLFPSAAFAWRLSEEPFMHGVPGIDDAKLRLSVGRTGNQDIGNYAYLATLGSSTYLFNGGTKVIGYSPDRLPNPDLKWETTDESNVGLDLAMLRSRVMLTADAYHRKTRDLLLEVAVPATIGVRSQLRNIGSVRNRGLELGINTVNLAGALGWTSTLNLAWNRNEVLNIGDDTIQIGPVGVGSGANQNPTVLKVGEPLNSFFGYVYEGMDALGKPVYADLNGDGQPNEGDRTIIGNAQPRYTGGFTNQLTWRSFDLSVFLNFSVGNKIYNINRAILTNNAGTSNQLTDVLAAGNTGANGIPRPASGNTFDATPSTLFVEDGSYLRGKNIRLAYTLPNALLARGRIGNLNNAQIYVSAQNFFTVTSYTGFDPEVTTYASSVLAQGIDFGTYPQTRQITVGFTAGF